MTQGETTEVALRLYQPQPADFTWMGMVILGTFVSSIGVGQLTAAANYLDHEAEMHGVTLTADREWAVYETYKGLTEDYE
jgi:hypothetical protein